MINLNHIRDGRRGNPENDCNHLFISGSALEFGKIFLLRLPLIRLASGLTVILLLLHIVGLLHEDQYRSNPMHAMMQR